VEDFDRHPAALAAPELLAHRLLDFFYGGTQLMKVQMPTTTLAALMLATTLAQSAAAAGNAEPAGPDPRAVLSGMAGFLGAQDSFSVRIKSGYDAVQDSGTKVEFMERRDVVVDRPGRMRIDIVRSDGDRSVVLADGKTVTAQNLTRNVYAQTEAKASLDDTIVHFVRDLKMRLPLAMLMLSKLEGELAGRVVNAEYVETTSILGEPAHHIVASTDTMDFQVWVSAGKEPLPQRVVLTYRDEEGTPQYRATFEDWDLSPRVRDGMFEFEAPKGASKIAFLNQVPPVAVSNAAAAAAE
jgi:hypothetical protein